MDRERPEDETQDSVRPMLLWTFAAMASLFIVVAWSSIFYVGLKENLWREVIRHNFAAMILLPACCGFALVLVLVLRATAGKIEFEVLGLKFRGASGPLVFWVLCFLAQILGVKLLWNDPPDEKPAAKQHAVVETGAPRAGHVTGTPVAPSPP
jgi:hypothetical protein